MLRERNVLNVVITLGLASIRSRLSADLATELGFGVKSYNSKTGRGGLNGQQNKMHKAQKIITLDADNCRAEHILECFKRVNGGKAKFVLF